MIGVGLDIDPTLTRKDRLVGNVIGVPGHLPDVFNVLKIKFFLLRTLLGVSKNDGGRVSRIRKDE